MDTEKPINKMTKKELLAVIADCTDQSVANLNSIEQMREERDTWDKVKEKLIAEKHEAITALEVWKSGCLDAQALTADLQNRLLEVRQMMEEELIKNPVEKAETAEEKESIVHSIVKTIAKKLIALENKVTPFMHSYLPVPRIIKAMQEAQNEKTVSQPKSKLEETLCQKFFNDRRTTQLNGARYE